MMKRVGILVAFSAFTFVLCARDFDVRDFGAKGDGRTKNTEAIQAAIDAANRDGGGRVVFDRGVYMTGTIHLKSGVELHVEANATILGSDDWRDWRDQPDAEHIDTYMCARYRSAALIFADEAENIALTGRGKIDGNGMKFVEPDPKRGKSAWHLW